MSSSLWPSFAGKQPHRGMPQILHEMVGDIDAQTGGAIKFFVDTVGMSKGGPVRELRHNCYLRAKDRYNHLFFRVTTPISSTWPATLVTPEGESYSDLLDEAALRDAIREVLHRPATE